MLAFAVACSGQLCNGPLHNCRGGTFHESLTTGLVDALSQCLRCTVTVMGPSKVHYGAPFVGRRSLLLGDPHPLACLGSVQERPLMAGSVSTTNSSSLIRTKVVRMGRIWRTVGR